MISSSGDYRGVADEYPTKHAKTVSRMEGTAMRLGWSIPDEFKDDIIARQVEIAVDPDSSNRESTAAARAIISANAQNVQIGISLPATDAESATVEISHAEYLAAMRKTVPRVADGNAQ